MGDDGTGRSAARPFASLGWSTKPPMTQTDPYPLRNLRLRHRKCGAADDVMVTRRGAPVTHTDPSSPWNVRSRHRKRDDERSHDANGSSLARQRTFAPLERGAAEDRTGRSVARPFVSPGAGRDAFP